MQKTQKNNMQYNKTSKKRRANHDLNRFQTTFEPSLNHILGMKEGNKQAYITSYKLCSTIKFLAEQGETITKIEIINDCPIITVAGFEMNRAFNRSSQVFEQIIGTAYGRHITKTLILEGIKIKWKI